ncbi:CBS domain-containing protein [Chelativorans sp. ZYF759]|uniref:CBS domain-containing protein n=1 Tax=Chelativorans sp. ZYF759 TaxID=2692213 RepID=UPI00145E708D|nr:CBS domain-containing protein [Chelativorans sp. ZYF759]NMG41247.1 CBS domain-containing protein [Chelativorans sp. ZYF759]
MTVRDILATKGNDVVTIGPSSTLADAARALAQHRIGAVVVTGPGDQIVGILSERDIVRVIGEQGADALSGAVSEAMSTSVKVCGEHHTVNEVMGIMTRGRFRHLPVERDGRLIGIVSIGDVVKQRIEDVEREAEEIRNYIATA